MASKQDQVFGELLGQALWGRGMVFLWAVVSLCLWTVLAALAGFSLAKTLAQWSILDLSYPSMPLAVIVAALAFWATRSFRPLEGGQEQE